MYTPYATPSESLFKKHAKIFLSRVGVSCKVEGYSTLLTDVSEIKKHFLTVKCQLGADQTRVLGKLRYSVRLHRVLKSVVMDAEEVGCPDPQKQLEETDGFVWEVVQ